jgi:hypothetical protein
MRNCWSMSRYTILVMVISMKKKGPYTVTCIKLAVFCYIMTVQTVVYVLCINLYHLKVIKLFLKHCIIAIAKKMLCFVLC